MVPVSGWLNRVKPAPAAPNGAVCVNEVKVVGAPVVIWPSTSEAGMFTGVAAPLVRAAAALEKKPTSVTAVREELRTQVVVMETGEVPAAVPPDTRGMVIVEGLAATVSDSPSVA